MNTSPEQQFPSAREMLERALFAGDENALESVLEKYKQITSDEDLVVELIYNEYLIREEQGESPKMGEFLSRFPAYANRIRRVFDIHATLSTEQTLVGFDSESLTLPRRLSPGDTVGPFELISSLGTGGRGFVFKARQVELDRIVALKILKSNATNDQEIRRFLTEAKAAANLQHPNIVQVYESDIYENLPYIALEYIAGGTLDEQYLGAPVASKEAARLIAVLAEAMQYAHDRGVVHRDLKPSNILLVEDGTPKITDFGLAKRLQLSRSEPPKPVTETGMVLGTPSYMAPEQAEGRNREIGPGTDVYGLGVVLYQLITGQVPFVGESTLDVLESIRTIDPVPPSSLNPKVPPDLETICLKCLEKEPASRYLTAADLAADLHRFVSGHPIVARPASYWQRFAKLAHRHPVTTALSVGLIAAVFVVIGVISWQWKQAAIGEHTQAMLRNSAEESLYSQQLALAHKEINSSESQRALEVLNETDPLRRHWEWNYLRQSCDAYTTLAALGPDVSRCVANSDGSLLAVAKGRWGTDEPGALAVFDTSNQKLLYNLENAFGPVMDVAFSPDGETIATVSNRFKSVGGQISIHDAWTGEAKRVIPFPASGLFGIAYHPSQTKIALALANHSVEIWDGQIKKRIHHFTGHRDSCYRVAFHPAGDQLASCSRDGTARLWNTRTGKQDAVLRARNVLRAIAYTPDGRYVVTNGYDQAIQFWDLLEDPPQHSKIHLAGEIPLTYGLSISPQGRYLRAFGDGGRRLFSYDLSLKRVKVSSAETAKRPFWLTHHPRENRLYLVDADGNVLQSNARHVSRFQRFVTASATDVALNANDDRIAIASGTSRATPRRRDFRCRMLSVSEPDSQIQYYDGAPTWSSTVAVSPDGQVLACGCEDGTILFWEADSGDLLAESTFHREKIVGLAFVQSGEGLISIDSDGCLAKWQGPSPHPVSRVKLCDSELERARFTSDAKHIVLHSKDGRVSLLSTDRLKASDSAAPSLASAGSILWTTNKPKERIRSFAFSPTNQYLAIATQDSLELWATNSAENRLLWSVAMPLTSATDIAFHPDGERLALVDGWGGRVVLFANHSGHKVLELNTRSGTDRATIAFSMNGDALVATLAGELYVWRLADSKSQDEAAKVFEYSSSQYKTDFQWHVNQASEQIFGGLPFGAEFHSRRALSLLSKHQEKIAGLRTLEVLTLNANCHLAKSLIDSGRPLQGQEMFDQIVAECPNSYRSLQALSLLLATYPGSPIISTERLIDLADRALDMQSDDSNAWATVGIAHYRDGNMAEARRYLEHAESIMTEWDGLVLFPLAVVEAKSEDYEAAAERFALGVEWMKSTIPKQPIIRELHRWAAEELGSELRDFP